MAKKHIIDQDTFTTWNISHGGAQWTLATSASIGVGGTLGEKYGISETSEKSDNRIDVKGDVTAGGPYGLAAINIAGHATALHVFKNATLVSETGIKSSSVDAFIWTEGRIEAELGIDAVHARSVVNEGEIIGYDGIISDAGSETTNSGVIDVDNVGITVEAGGTVIRNLDGGVIDALSLAIKITGAGTTRLINDGEITGGLLDFDGELTLVNRNFLEGHVILGGGNDIFDTRGGVFDGTIEGGSGHDIYKLSTDDVTIEEALNDGYDKVVSSANVGQLADNIEELVLIGTKDRYANANSSANTIVGNKGDNLLSGFLGEDRLDGGAGDDRLYGGGDSDMFVFERKSGVDIVEDFLDGVDLLQLSFINTSKDEKELFKHHVKQQGDDVVITYGADRLVIRNLDIDDFDAGDLGVPS